MGEEVFVQANPKHSSLAVESSSLLRGLRKSQAPRPLPRDAFSWRAVPRHSLDRQPCGNRFQSTLMGDQSISIKHPPAAHRLAICPQIRRPRGAARSTARRR